MIEVTPLTHGGPGPTLELLRAADGDTESDLRAAARARSAALPPERRCSRAYAHPLALHAHHDGPVGVDLERVAPCDVVFAASICTPVELDSLRVLDWAEVTSLWSSKEALAKALGDARLYDPRRLDGPAGWADGASGRWRARSLELGADYRGWICWAAASRSATRASRPSRSLIAGP